MFVVARLKSFEPDRLGLKGVLHTCTFKDVFWYRKTQRTRIENLAGLGFSNLTVATHKRDTKGRPGFSKL
jgi:hypothetical protein